MNLFSLYSFSHLFPTSPGQVDREPLLHTYGNPDVFGRCHRKNGDTIFNSYERDGELSEFDALAITELNEAYIPPQQTSIAPLYLPPGQTIPNRMVVTSPNANWMPFISLRPRACALSGSSKASGIFHLSDRVRQRPQSSTSSSVFVGGSWERIILCHVEAKGSAYRNLGTLRGDIADFLRGKAKKLHVACRDVKQLKDFGRLFYLANKTADAAFQLKYCSFTRRDLIYHISGFQRLYLETLWAFRLNDGTGKIYEIDKTIMGAIADSPDCIVMLYRVVRGRPANEYDRRAFTYKDFPGMPFPTVVTACPRRHFGPLDPQVVVEASGGLAMVNSSPSPALSAPHTVPVSPTVNKSAQGILAKFHEPDLDHVPPQSPAWKTALEAVDMDSRRVFSTPAANKYRGYQFPDPFLFINGSNHRSMMLAWLMMRAQWLQSLINTDSAPQLPVPQLPVPQHWRNFLHDFAKEMGLLPTIPSTSIGSHGGVQEKKGKDQTHQGSEELPFSQGQGVMQGDKDDGLAPNIMSQVIWNTFEQNFRYEIRQLDRHLLPAAWASDSEAGLREDLIRRIFPDDSNGLVVSAGPPSIIGLAAENWKDRLKHVEALRQLVKG
ncbi:uncharacterized protein LACBIDRAFT_331189 [Laccaria bicolor S238N-H82]|uniref:Predicted protein n=1 Tax=Laccaria bicolor (strain S238N-H82 / ATCC MYA-4686) TaxID=486041 RepID=B0DNQ9_LACBS|nr:uncharacterized protein LACBIDRAFT_331189 [Laccaria bicolor S238N-H82]EDR03695.1 predicted protein [Laccaria bicolor S238N-H82]|eukprot:XP_001885548.1 predicted protein [Laccaria bicolor S238N-H82]